MRKSSPVWKRERRGKSSPLSRRKRGGRGTLLPTEKVLLITADGKKIKREGEILFRNAKIFGKQIPISP